MQDLGRILIFAGLVLLVIGSVLYFSKSLPWLGKLPGDIYFRKGNFSFYFPLMTSVLISLALTLLIYLINKK